MKSYLLPTKNPLSIVSKHNPKLIIYRVFRLTKNMLIKILEGLGLITQESRDRLFSLKLTNSV